MQTLLADFWRFCRRKDSDSATCVVIGLAEHMSQKDRRQMAEYLEALIEVDNRKGAA